jgi:benzylsuccinate CoA-transferase BbsF subunit
LNVLAGIYGMTGYHDGVVAGPGTNFPDHSVNPGHALVAIMAALIHRKRTGRGQYIEVSQLESTLNLLGPSILAYSLNRENPAPQGNTSPEAAPYGVFPCANDEWIAISVTNDRQWQGLAKVAAGQAFAGDARFAATPARQAAAAELAKSVSAWTKGQRAAALMQALQDNAVPAGVVQDARHLVDADPQLAHRGHFVTLDHSEMGPTVYNNAPYRLSRTPGGPQRAAPLLGQHNQLVFNGMLSIGDEELEKMKAADAFK